MADIHSAPTQPDSLASPGTPMRLFRRVFSFPAAIGALLVLLGALTVRGRFDDPDMWWHLKSGQVIWTTHHIFKTDIFSYTTNHHAFVPQEWLAQVSIYAAYRWAGFPGLMLWLVVLTSMLLVAGYFLCSSYAQNAKVGFIGAMTIWFFGTIGLSIRPQLIGYVLLIGVLLAIHLGRTRSSHWFFCLPFLFAVWVNCHGSFFLGIVATAIILGCSIFNFSARGVVSSRWDAPRRRSFLWAVLLSLAALLVNPDGIRQVLYPLDTFFLQPINLANVEEWRPLNLLDPRGVGLLAVLLCIILLVIFQKSEIQIDELTLLAIGTWLALRHTRLLFVFGIFAAPVLSRQLAAFWERYQEDEDRIWPNAVLIGLALLGTAIAFPSTAALRLQVEQKSPVKAVDFIRSAHLSGPMMNDYTSGGYLIWTAPEYPVFIDGRADVYEWSGILGEFGKWATLQTDPNSLLDRYHINFCLFSNEAPMSHALQQLKNWKLVYSDNNAVVFLRTPR